MCHSSPASLLVWGILSSLLGTFLLYHLWAFDRFQCLRWNDGRDSGTFKRLMTYSYLLSIPMIMTYSLGFAVIKYQEGFIQVPGFGIIPKPSTAWSQANQNAIFPLYLIFSISWSFEIVTHLEELCFWLFLVNAGSTRQDWFSSFYFKTWTFGSVVAVIYMPLNEAFTFLAGSLGSLSLTLWFIPILWTFPSFLYSLGQEGADTNTLVRLTKFHELNTLRVYFRFLFTLPLLALAIDGVLPRPYINTKMLWIDILTMLSGVGVIVSSAITIVIFFPRSVEGEIAIRQASLEKRREKALGMKRHSTSGTFVLPPSPTDTEQNYPRQDRFGNAPSSFRYYETPTVGETSSGTQNSSVPKRPNRGFDADEAERGIAVVLTELSISKHNVKVYPDDDSFTADYGRAHH